ncbi:Protein vip1 [Ceratocystis lukuohia]|uniref:Protein vip1 n=2 Tax=Ceratocystis TaxID=5157 RepID=A0A0F8CPS3_CERFI|nr:Protein vip1 [Ceratocystis platani]
MTNVVYVTDISASTDDKEIKEFFSFCGKVTAISIEADGADKKKATVTFEKDTAMKTALLLHHTQLGSSKITVTGSANLDEHNDPTPAQRDGDEITQEEKPRSRILAEYLAHGYVVGDAALEQAVVLDKKHNVSQRFLTTLQSLDSKYKATDRARATDESYGISTRGKGLLFGLNSYFEKAVGTPAGKKIAKFYEEGSKQAQDIHTEARRLADLKKDQAGGSAYRASGLEKVFGKARCSATTDSAGVPNANVPLSPQGAASPAADLDIKVGYPSDTKTASGPDSKPPPSM